MRVVNTPEGTSAPDPEALGAQPAPLSPRGARLGPAGAGPEMAFDRPLQVGASGGHGPIGYRVEAYRPGRSVWFAFLRPAGFAGGHGLEIEPLGGGRSLLRHRLEMTVSGAARLSWPLAFRPLHDALVEDALTRAETELGLPPTVRRWSFWVRVLRWFLSGGRARPQAPAG
ncbi:hypothetical protein [Stappia sp.]|uniref:hypothetical protein n=1 Tax=Stappia sp. TaxID=1870903 RepID=UPI003A9A1FD5